jgi:hypothetical protein
MGKQRKRVKHDASFEERLAEEAKQFKEAAEKQPHGVRPANCFYAELAKPKQLRA